MPYISIIVTVHNSEKYIRESLESIRNQTFNDYEVLCIDSSTKDASPDILKYYANMDSRFRAITDLNGSYGHKINVGIHESKGKYIAVLESDDTYEPDMLETLFDVAMKTNADYVNGQYQDSYSVEGDSYTIPHRMYNEEPYNCLLGTKENLANLEIMDRFWTGIIRRQFIIDKKILLNESPGASYQDLSFRFLVSVLANSCYHVSNIVYSYRMDNPESSMKDNTKVLTIADEFKYLKEELIKRFDKNAWVWRLFYYWKYNDFHYNMFRLPQKERMILFERYQSELESDLNELPEELRCLNLYMSSDILTRPDNFLQGVEKSHQELISHNQFIIDYIGRKSYSIVLFGSGTIGKWLLESVLCNSLNKILYIIDNDVNKIGTKLVIGENNQFDIKAPESVVKEFPKALYIIANKNYCEEMKEQLTMLGIEEKNILVYT